MSNTNLAAAAAPQSWAVPAAILAAGTFAIGTDSFVLAGILPQLQQGLGVSAGAAGQVVTVFALTYAVAAPVLAATTGRVPRKALLLVALALFTLANVATAAAPTLAWLLVARIFAALGAAMFTPAASAAAAALAGNGRHGRALSIILGGLTVGTVFGVPIGTSLGQSFGWQASILFVAAVALLALLAIAFTLPALAPSPVVSLRQRLSVMANPRILLVVAVNGVSTLAGILVYTYIAELLAPRGFTGAAFALALLVWGAGGSAGAFLSGWLTDRIGADRTLLLAIAMLGLSLLALAFATPAWLVLPLLALYSAAGWSPTTPNNARLVGLAPQFPAVAISFNSSANYIGQALGALLGGLILAAGAAPATLCLAGAIAALVALGLQALTMHR